MSGFWKPIIKTLAPNFVLRYSHKIRSQLRAHQLMRSAAISAGRSNDPADWFNIVIETSYLHSQQVRAEIIRFLNLVRVANISSCLEIGTARGGTLFMLMHACSPSATVVSIDINNPKDKQLRLQFARQPTQKLYLLEGDSHSMEILGRVQRYLQGSQLDLLFIDGDHSYAGVKKDFELYAPLVKEDGIIALHDIVPDYHTRFGYKTISNTGEVYRFWQEIRERYDSIEIVEDVSQDGYGIGVLFK